jgi:hypothetical protein
MFRTVGGDDEFFLGSVGPAGSVFLLPLLLVDSLVHLHEGCPEAIRWRSACGCTSWVQPTGSGLWVRSLRAGY